MYLWDIRGLALKIRHHKISPHHKALYCFLSPLLSISSGIFFGVLLFSHQVVEYSFKNWLPIDHPYTAYYNYWSLTMTIATMIISFGGIYLCYRANKQGDGKDFWTRMACLSFPINFHIIVYTLATLCITGIVIYFALNERITLLQESIWPSTPATTEASTLNTPTGSFLTGWFRTPLAFIKLPFAPLKIKPLLNDIRAMVMLGYPALSVIPPLLSLTHYLIVRRMIKKVARITNPTTVHVKKERP